MARISAQRQQFSNTRSNNYAWYALWRIKDKRYISAYLTILSNPDEAARFPLTMIMLAKWNVVEAKPFFIKYLNCSNDNLVFLSVEALSFYADDGTIKKEIEKKEKSSNKDLVAAAKKAKKRLEKHKKLGSSASCNDS